jgi:hypothetical protein
VFIEVLLLGKKKDRLSNIKQPANFAKGTATEINKKVIHSFAP